MHYTLYQNKNKQVPGVIVVLMLLLLVGGLAYFLSGRDIEPVVTQDASVLARVDTANVRDTTVTVYWRTEAPTRGYIEYGNAPDALTTVAYDNQDVAANPTLKHNHVVNLTGLDSDSTVYFRINVDGQSLGQTAEAPFTVQTARPLTSGLDIDPIYGDISRSTGEQEENAVVVMHVSTARPLLTRTNQDGTFLFSPCCLYDSQSGEPIYPSETDSVKVEVIAEDGTSKILQTELASVSPLNNSIVIDANEKLFVEADAEPEEPEVLAVSDSVITFESVDIIYPVDEAYIPGTRPLIKGVGEPGELIKGSFTDEDRIFQVTVDENRNWVYEPTFDLAAGQHEVSVVTRDDAGNPVQLTRSFTILKSGESVLGDATDSATITPTAALTPDPTSTPSPTGLVTATPTPPVSGISILPVAMLSLVLIVIGAGIILLF